MSISNRTRLILDQYGPNKEDADSSVTEGDEMTDSTMSDISIAAIHMRMSVMDGEPANIYGCPYLFIGSAGAAYNFTKLLQTGITHIICLSARVKLSRPQDFSYLRINLQDSDAETIFAGLWVDNDGRERCWAGDDRLQMCFDFIDTAKISHGRCLVHCFQGRSRSAAIIAAYMIQRLQMSLPHIMAILTSARTDVRPNEYFMKCLRTMSETK